MYTGFICVCISHHLYTALSAFHLILKYNCKSLMMFSLVLWVFLILKADLKNTKQQHSDISYEALLLETAGMAILKVNWLWSRLLPKSPKLISIMFQFIQIMVIEVLWPTWDYQKDTRRLSKLGQITIDLLVQCPALVENQNDSVN